VTFSIFSCFLHIQAAIFQAPRQSRHPERSASQIYRKQRGFMARSRRTPAMLVGRCSWELSGRKLQRKIKKSQTPSAAEGSAVPRTFLGNTESRPAKELSSRPERTRISCHAALETTACAAFSTESRMKFTNATNINRKFGVAQWRDLRVLFLGSHKPLLAPVLFNLRRVKREAWNDVPRRHDTHSRPNQPTTR
jgi:hypothetical protein